MDPNTTTPEALQEKIQQFHESANQAKTIGVETQAQIQQMKQDSMRQAFQILENMGVNPADPKSLADFMQNLEQVDPDAAELMQIALQGLFGDPADAPEQLSSDQAAAPLSMGQPPGSPPQMPPSLGPPGMGQ